MMLLNRPPRRFLPPQRLTNARADILPRDPGTRSELRIANRAAHTRIVSVARIRLDSWKSVRTLKGIFCADISEFESDHLARSGALEFGHHWSPSGHRMPQTIGPPRMRARSSR